MCKKYGVDIRLNTEATLSTIQGEEPDVVIVATSALPVCPPFKGLDQHAVANARDVPENTLVGYKAMVIGGGQVGCETIDYPAHQDHKVTTVEMMH